MAQAVLARAVCGVGGASLASACFPPLFLLLTSASCRPICLASGHAPMAPMSKLWMVAVIWWSLCGLFVQEPSSAQSERTTEDRRYQPGTTHTGGLAEKVAGSQSQCFAAQPRQDRTPLQTLPPANSELEAGLSWLWTLSAGLCPHFARAVAPSGLHGNHATQLWRDTPARHHSGRTTKPDGGQARKHGTRRPSARAPPAPRLGHQPQGGNWPPGETSPGHAAGGLPKPQGPGRDQPHGGQKGVASTQARGCHTRSGNCTPEAGAESEDTCGGSCAGHEGWLVPSRGGSPASTRGRKSGKPGSTESTLAHLRTRARFRGKNDSSFQCTFRCLGWPLSVPPNYGLELHAIGPSGNSPRCHGAPDAACSCCTALRGACEPRPWCCPPSGGGQVKGPASTGSHLIATARPGPPCQSCLPAPGQHAASRTNYSYVRSTAGEVPGAQTQAAAKSRRRRQSLHLPVSLAVWPQRFTHARQRGSGHRTGRPKRVRGRALPHAPASRGRALQPHGRRPAKLNSAKLNSAALQHVSYSCSTMQVGYSGPPVWRLSSLQHLVSLHARQVAHQHVGHKGALNQRVYITNTQQPRQESVAPPSDASSMLATMAFPPVPLQQDVAHLHTWPRAHWHVGYYGTPCHSLLLVDCALWCYYEIYQHEWQQESQACHRLLPSECLQQVARRQTKLKHERRVTYLEPHGIAWWQGKEGEASLQLQQHASSRPSSVSLIRQFLFWIFVAGLGDGGKSWRLFSCFCERPDRRVLANGISGICLFLQPFSGRGDFVPKWPKRVLPLLGRFLGPSFSASPELRERSAERRETTSHHLSQTDRCGQSYRNDSPSRRVAGSSASAQRHPPRSRSVHPARGHRIGEAARPGPPSTWGGLSGVNFNSALASRQSSVCAAPPSPKICSKIESSSMVRLFTTSVPEKTSRKRPCTCLSVVATFWCGANQISMTYVQDVPPKPEYR